MLHQNALRAYQNAEQNFLVDGADPHRLVQILFEELLTALQRCDIAMEAKDLPARSAASSKALSIIYVLGSSLDFEKGGEIANSLAQLYDWARLRLIAACRNNSREDLESIRKVISDIAEAWVTIASKAA